MPPLYENEHGYLTLQAADNLAYELYKVAANAGTQRPLRTPLKRRPKTGNILRTFRLQYRELELMANAQEHGAPAANIEPIDVPLKVLGET